MPSFHPTLFPCTLQSLSSRSSAPTRELSASHHAAAVAHEPQFGGGAAEAAPSLVSGQTQFGGQSFSGTHAAVNWGVKDVPTPREMVAALDQWVIGQPAAKKSLAVAVHNHYKRLQNKRLARAYEAAALMASAPIMGQMVRLGGGGAQPAAAAATCSLIAHCGRLLMPPGLAVYHLLSALYNLFSHFIPCLCTCIRLL